MTHNQTNRPPEAWPEEKELVEGNTYEHVTRDENGDERTQTVKIIGITRTSIDYIVV